MNDQNESDLNLDNQKAQSFLEYTMVIGVIVLILFAMGPMMKRGIQSLIKAVADEVGIQQGAEQRFDERGHLEASYVSTRASIDKQTQDLSGMTVYIYNDITRTASTTLTNLGFTEED